MFLFWLALAVVLTRLSRPIGDWRIGMLSVPLALAVVGFPLAQMLRNTPSSYPFTAWTMYSQSRTAVTYWRYAVVYDDGKEKDLPFEAVAFSEPRALVAKLDQRLRACRCAAGDTRLDAALTSILAVAHRGRSEAVAGVRIYQYRLRHPAIGPERMALSYTWEPTK